MATQRRRDENGHRTGRDPRPRRTIAAEPTGYDRPGGPRTPGRRARHGGR